ncbi:MAG TPA: AI-2E family transporter [Edaphocola sp.]|nr:AI-2E family transporter [Edaphocola sp.]
MESNKNTQQSHQIMQSVAFSLIVICISFFILVYAKAVLLPLVFAAIFALALMRPVSMLEKKGVPRVLAATICLLISIILLSGVFAFIATQIMSFEQDFPLLEEKLLSLINKLQNFAHNRLHISDEFIQNNFFPILKGSISKAPLLIAILVGFFSNSLFIVGFTFIYTLMFLVYKDNIAQFFSASFTHLEGISKFKIANKTQNVIRAYIIGLLLEMLFVAVMLSGAYYFLGAKYAILLGVISAIFNVVPYLGFITAAILSMLVTFATNTPQTALWVGVISIIIHLIDSNLFLPLVVGSKVSINALVTVIGVFLGSLLWGLPGMFLAVPIVAILKVAFDEIPGMQHWGILMGPRPKKKKRAIILKSINNSDAIN